MDHVIECSSIYDIDFTAILYDNIYLGHENYTVYLDCSANVDTNYQREHISRLAIPLLRWEKDAQNQLRQLHVPIDPELNREGFLEALLEALNQYSQQGCNSEALSDLFDEISAKTCHNMTGLECYMTLIETLIQRVCGVSVKVNDFSPIRQDGSSETKSFLLDAINEFSKLKDGNYKFSKGGRIELLDDSHWIKIESFCISNNSVVFYDDTNCKVDAGLILSDETKVRLRGPLETIALCKLGTLIDLPWYLDASFSEERANGLEFISPISVVASERVSKWFGGNGSRLCPSGYSLIEYYTPHVEKVLKDILAETTSISHNDLEDWLQLINNYPVSNQKIAKSLRSVKIYCDGLIQKRFNEATHNRFKIEQLQNSNYVSLGKVLVNMCLTLRYYRQTSSEQSPYYNNPNFIKSYYRYNNIDEFYNDSIVVINKCKKLFSRFHIECKAIQDFVSLINSAHYFLENAVLNQFDEREKFYHLVSKLEKYTNEIVRDYYTIALFITGVLLKANIFTLFCVIGDGKVVKYKIEDILEKRDNKYLKYRPLWYERTTND